MNTSTGIQYTYTVRNYYQYHFTILEIITKPVYIVINYDQNQYTLLEIIINTSIH